MMVGRKSVIALVLSVVSAYAGLEVNAGWASPGKGLLGIRYGLMDSRLSLGLLFGGVGTEIDYDFGAGYSYHPWGRTGGYVFQSHHWLHSQEDVWEVATGLGYQYQWSNGLLLYGETGVPFYAGHGHYYSDYEAGELDNSGILLRLGFGLGYEF